MRPDSAHERANFADEENQTVPLNVVIAYDQVSAGQRAMRALTKLTDALDPQLELHPQAWRLDLLEDPDWRIMAAADVIKADIVIISVGGNARLSSIVESWLTACLARKRSGAAAVVALQNIGDPIKDPGPPRFGFLKDAADKAGLDFFLASSSRVTSLTGRIDDIHRRAETITHTLDQILHAARPAAQGRRWRHPGEELS